MSGDPAPPQDQSEGSPPVVTPEIAAEAAVWVARLHGPDRSSRMERECLGWQQRSAAHRLAFERCTETWQDVALVSLVDAFASANPHRPEPRATGWKFGPDRSRWALGLVAVVLVSAGLVFVQLRRDEGLYETGIGEQRTVILDDGTRVSLNTDSRLRVDLDARQRTVHADDGEALFEVARDPQRPFVVSARGSEIVAAGTVFDVRLSSDRGSHDEALAVTLIEGQLTVRRAAGDGPDDVAPPKPLSMQPGERISLVRSPVGSGAAPTLKVDRPPIDEVVAWKRGEAVFEDVSLADAVAEMNRYNRTQIVLLGGPSVANLRVSGMFRTGDAANFAQAVAALHGLVVREGAGRLELRKPQ